MAEKTFEEVVKESESLLNTLNSSDSNFLVMKKVLESHLELIKTLKREISRVKKGPTILR